MKILSIETSCDETSAAVITDQNGSIEVISNITATSLLLHAATGGIIPENAARMQVKYIIPVIVEALLKSKKIKASNVKDDWEVSRQILKNDIDAIAVTYGPGLIGSLLVGVESAKTLSFVFKKPLIPVNHLLAHIYANFIRDDDNLLLTTNKLEINNTPEARSQKPEDISFPFVGLIVSGGHTDLLLFKSNKKYNWLGGTRDDACGEALDKIGRLLDLPYPAGAEIERRSNLFLKTKKKSLVKFKSPIINSEDFDFSFSGLKTEALRFVQKNPKMNDHLKNEICYATQKAVIDVLVKKTIDAALKYNSKTILVGGGVSANQTFISQLKLNAKSLLDAEVFSPEKVYCTDNAAMIGAYALLNPEEKEWKEVIANPELYFE